MRLFCEKGYESTSMADIAKELHVVQGLCYRYYPSKQALFDTAMQQYVEECSAEFIKIVHDRSKTIQERMKTISALMLNEGKTSRYHSFYHKPGNEALHEMLSIRMCKYMIPHVQEELEQLCREGVIQAENPELLTEFIMYGQLSLFQNRKESYLVRLRQIKIYIEKLLGIKAMEN